MAFFNDDDKRKIAYVAFLDYLKRTERSCRKIDELDDWSEKLKFAEEMVLDLPSMLENFSEVLSNSSRNKLREFLDFPKMYNKDPTNAGSKFIEQIHITVNELENSKESTERRSQNIQQKSSLSFNVSPKILITIIGIIVISLGSAIFLGNDSDENQIKPELDKDENPIDIAKIKEEEDIRAPPMLLSPANDYVTCTNSPMFEWEISKHEKIKDYTIEVYDATGQRTITRNTTSTSVDNLQIKDDGGYSWKVRANYETGKTTEFSEAFAIIIQNDIKSPPAPVAISPKNLETVYDNTPEFIWEAVEDRCEIEYYTIVISKIGKSEFRDRSYTNSYISKKTLDEGGYSWKVRAVDRADNAGRFSKIQIINIVESR